MRDVFRDFLEDDGDLSDLIEVSEDGAIQFKGAPKFDTTPLISAGVGAVAGSGVSLVEKGSGLLHQTVFTLASVIIPTATTGDTQIGVGGIKIYDFPAGAILRLGCQADLSSLVVAADQSKLIDGATPWKIGFGSIIPANQDALGTDAADDDWGTAVQANNSAHIDADIEVVSEAVGIHADGTLDLNMSADIPDAEITDTGGAVTIGIEISGTVTVTWIPLGLFG